MSTLELTEHATAGDVFETIARNPVELVACMIAIGGIVAAALAGAAHIVASSRSHGTSQTR